MKNSFYGQGLDESIGELAKILRARGLAVGHLCSKEFIVVIIKRFLLTVGYGPN